MGTSTNASGESSTAMGTSTTASGKTSTAMGDNTTASGESSTAMGYSVTAIGVGSTAMGTGTTASGKTSTAMGSFTNAIGIRSIAIGDFTTASGHSSTAMGTGTTASGQTSTAMGRYTTASGFSSTTMGENTIAKSLYETVIGFSNDTIYSTNMVAWVDTDPLFIIGNGSWSTKHNAMMVLKNGNTGIGGYPGATGKNVFAIKTGTVPTSSITDGVLLYAEYANAELRVRDELGNTTTLSPHNFNLTSKSEPMAWSFYSENENVGYKINVDMLKAIRTIENISGEKLVYLQDLETKESVNSEYNNESLVDIVKQQKQEIQELNNKIENIEKQNTNEIDQLKAQIEELKELMGVKNEKEYLKRD